MRTSVASSLAWSSMINCAGLWDATWASSSLTSAGNDTNPTLHGALQRHHSDMLVKLRMHWTPVPLLMPEDWPRGTIAVALPLDVVPALQRERSGQLVWTGSDVTSGSDWTDALPATLQGASPQRIRSFVAGRLCAEEVLRRLNGAKPTVSDELREIPLAVGQGLRGEPLWPQPLLGSITHSARWAAAVVCPKNVIHGIGIDYEEYMDAQTHAAACQVCFTPLELKKFPELARNVKLATAVYAAKEAFYKAIWPHVQRFVDFMEVEVLTLNRDCGVLSFQAQSPDVMALLREHWMHQFTERAGTAHAVSAMFSNKESIYSGT